MTRESWMEVLPPMDHYFSGSSWFLGPSRRGGGGGGGAAAGSWTPQENKLFEDALARIEPHTLEQWEKVAAAIPGKTVEDVVSHYQSLVLDVRQIEAGLVPCPGYGASSFTLDWEGGNGVLGEFRPGYCVGGGGGGKRHGSRAPEQERKKGVPWTEDEHKLFLLGLQKYGKGDWRNISRNFVHTRTPTQVASHAQKYFIRLNSGGKDKRRSSIHDITTVSLTDDRPPSPSQPPLLGTQSNASTPSAAVGQFPPTVDTKSQNVADRMMQAAFGMGAYGMSLQDQDLRRGPLHDMLFQMQSALSHPH